MTSCGNTGPTVPGWIRERVARLERAWPPLVLAAATAGVIAVEVWLGVTLWVSGGSVYYALPW